MTLRHPLGMVGLEQFEAAGAGHCLSRHVHDAGGQFASDAERLAGDPAIPASGAFSSRAEAQSSVDAAVRANARRIVRWRAEATRFSPFIAELELGRVNGAGLSREQFEAGMRASVPTTGVRIVLLPDGGFSAGFAVHTAYNVATPQGPPVALAVGALALPAIDGEDEDGGLRRFSSPRAARRAVALGVAHWSADIAAWLAAAGGAPRLTRTYCSPRSVGGTLSGAERRGGQARLTTTPLVEFTLRRAATAGGFEVVRALPQRGF